MALNACNPAENLAAYLIPTAKQDIEITDIKSGTYQLDSDHVGIRASFDHMGFSRKSISFGGAKGTLTFDGKNPGKSTLQITLDMTQIFTGSADFDELLLGKDFFDVEKFPEAAFSSSEVYFTSDTAAQVPGTLTLHGKEVPVVFNITLGGAGSNWVKGAYTLGFSAEAQVNRSDFDLKNLLALTGDEVLIEIDAEFNRVGD